MVEITGKYFMEVMKQIFHDLSKLLLRLLIEYQSRKS